MAGGALWATSSHGDTADTQPLDLDALRAHKAQCTTASGHWVALQCGARHLQGLVLGRLVTSMAIVACLGAALLLLL